MTLQDQNNYRNTKMTATHHALLFSCISKSLIDEIGKEKGEPILSQAVQTYGHQRGKRMALRARANNHALTMANYLAYGEWSVPKDEMEFRLMDKRPHARMHVVKCPWHSAWEKRELLEFGKYFCKEIDRALVHGFNPDLTIDIRSTQTNGGSHCEFIFKEADLSFFKLLGLAYKKKISPGTRAVMPWEYHSGHLYKTMGQIFQEALGDVATQIMDTGLSEFTQLFPDCPLETITQFQNTDFNILPREEI